MRLHVEDAESWSKYVVRALKCADLTQPHDCRKCADCLDPEIERDRDAVVKL